MRPELLAGGTVISTDAVERRHRHFGAEHSLVEGQRQIEPEVLALDAEIRMFGDMDGDHHVAGLAAQRARLALALEANLLAVLDAGRHRHVEGTARRQHDARARARRRFGERNGQRGRHIGAAGVGGRGRAPWLRAAPNRSAKISDASKAAGPAGPRERPPPIELEMFGPPGPPARRPPAPAPKPSKP